MLRRSHLAAFFGLGLLAWASSARAVVLVNDTWKDGTDSDPVFGDSDFNNVGGVNGDDFLIWQRGLGAATGSGTPGTGDANNDMNINAADLAIWRAQYGASSTAGGYSENGVDVDGDGDIESAWYQGGTGELNPTGVNGPLRGSTHNPADGVNLSTSSASWTTYFKPPGEKVVLANQGDSLKVTWKFSLVNVNPAGNTSQAFDFAVVDSGTRVTAAAGSPPSGIYAGYAIYGNMGPTLGHANSFQLKERTLATQGNLLNTGADFGGIIGNGATSGEAGYTSGTEYTMTWIMTRGAGDSLDLDVSMAGGTEALMLGDDGLIQVQANDATPNTFQYDTFALRPNREDRTATEFLTSLFKVEFLPGPVVTAVPEPSMLACSMMAVGALAGVARRRRAA